MRFNGYKINLSIALKVSKHLLSCSYFSLGGWAANRPQDISKACSSGCAGHTLSHKPSFPYYPQVSVKQNHSQLRFSEVSSMEATNSHQLEHKGVRRGLQGLLHYTGDHFEGKNFYLNPQYLEQCVDPSSSSIIFDEWVKQIWKALDLTKPDELWGDN